MKNGKKGVIFTIPNFEDLAFMQWYPTAELKRKASSILISYRGYDRQWNSDLRLDTSKEFYLMPTPNVVELFKNFRSGETVNATLTDVDVMDEIEVQTSRPAYYNEQVRKMAKELNLALVDLELIYKQIHQGTYIAEGGIAIDGKPSGNFFSSDGTYPTALGQAVIANEVIKSINSTYQTRIPLLNVREFLSTTNAK